MTLWFLARAAGFVALLAATLTVALGASAPRPAHRRSPSWPTSTGGCSPSWCTGPQR